MHWHFVLLAAFLMESQLPARAVMIVIVDFEFQHCAHTGDWESQLCRRNLAKSLVIVSSEKPRSARPHKASCDRTR
jgi:hypothetical protein